MPNTRRGNATDIEYADGTRIPCWRFLLLLLSNFTVTVDERYTDDGDTHYYTVDDHVIRA